MASNRLRLMPSKSTAVPLPARHVPPDRKKPRMKLSRVLAASLVAAASLLSAPALATSPAANTPMMVGVDANKILAEVDRRASVFEDQVYHAEMEVFKAGTLNKTLVFDAKMKGLDKQFLTFTAPGDIAGMKVLMQDAETLYIYTPEFKKVRRVAAHMQNQGFLGSAFTYEDMTLTLLAPYYDAELAGREGSETTLNLTLKEGKKLSFPRLEVVIDGTKGGVTKIRYFDGADKMVRQQLRDDWVKIEGELMPTKITMSDLKSGDSSVIRISDVQVNTGVEDDLFSRRMLLRG